MTRRFDADPAGLQLLRGLGGPTASDSMPPLSPVGCFIPFRDHESAPPGSSRHGTGLARDGHAHHASHASCPAASRGDPVVPARKQGACIAAASSAVNFALARGAWRGGINHPTVRHEELLAGERRTTFQSRKRLAASAPSGGHEASVAASRTTPARAVPTPRRHGPAIGKGSSARGGPGRSP